MSLKGNEQVCVLNGEIPQHFETEPTDNVMLQGPENGDDIAIKVFVSFQNIEVIVSTKSIETNYLLNQSNGMYGLEDVPCNQTNLKVSGSY